MCVLLCTYPKLAEFQSAHQPRHAAPDDGYGLVLHAGVWWSGGHCGCVRVSVWLALHSLCVCVWCGQGSVASIRGHPRACH